jgi:hypothetical protein
MARRVAAQEAPRVRTAGWPSWPSAAYSRWASTIARQVSIVIELVAVRCGG